MISKASVKFYLVKGPANIVKSFIFLNEKINTEGNSILKYIPLSKFEGTNNCLPCDISLLNDKNEIIVNHIFNVYRGNNVSYLFLENIGFTYEFIFLNQENHPIILNNESCESDNNSNIYRQRVSFINYHLNYIQFKNIKFIPSAYFSAIQNYNDFTSFQYSFYNDKLVIIQPNKLFNPNLDISDFYNEKKEKIYLFYTELEKIIKNATLNFKSQLEVLLNQYNEEYHKFKHLNFCKSKVVIKKSFAPNEYVEFFYYIIIIYMLKGKLDDIRTINDLISMLNKFKLFYEVIKKDSNLENYQKIFSLIQYSYIIKKYNEYSFKYKVVSNAEKNSIIYYAINFYKQFVSYINEDSPVFMRLLEINSGFGYYKDQKVFNFNLLNVNDIKEHMLEIIPEVIYFFNSANSKTKAFSFTMTGQITINEHFLFKQNEKMDLDKAIRDEQKKEAYNLAMILGRDLIHEDGGHIKFRNKSEDKIESPVKCVLDGKIKTMTYLSDINKNEKDFIRIFPFNKNGKGDSGHLLELAFGKIKNEYAIVYFDRIKNVGKLLFYPEYFVKKEKIKTLENYVYFKYLSEKKLKINENELPNEASLEEEIIYIKEKLKQLNELEKVQKDIRLLSKKHKIKHEENPNFRKIKLDEIITINSELKSSEIDEQLLGEDKNAIQEHNDEEKGIENEKKDKKKNEDNYVDDVDLLEFDNLGYDSGDDEICI